VANTNLNVTSAIQVVVDANLNPEGKIFNILFPLSLAGIAVSPVKTIGNFRCIEITIGAMDSVVLG